MRCRFCLPIALIALLFIVLASWPGTAQPSELRMDFEDAMTGALPSYLEPGLTGKGRPVAWQVVEDRTAPRGSKVIAETSGDDTSDRFPLAIYRPVSPANVAVAVAFKPISGKVDQAAGLMVRVKDARNYYIARANALEGNVRLYKVVNGKRQQFAGVDIPVHNGQWQRLGLRIEGERLEVSLNGTKLFEASDRTFSGPGMVGLWTKADSLTHFDDFTISVLP